MALTSTRSFPDKLRSRRASGRPFGVTKKPLFEQSAERSRSEQKQIMGLQDGYEVRLVVEDDEEVTSEVTTG